MLTFTLPAFRLIPGYCVEFGGTNYVITDAFIDEMIGYRVLVRLVAVHAPLDEPISFALNPDTKIDLNIPLL